VLSDPVLGRATREMSLQTLEGKGLFISTTRPTLCELWCHNFIRPPDTVSRAVSPHQSDQSFAQGRKLDSIATIRMGSLPEHKVLSSFAKLCKLQLPVGKYRRSVTQCNASALLQVQRRHTTYQGSNGAQESEECSPMNIRSGASCYSGLRWVSVQHRSF
jgi:hypothetical protein